MQQKLCTGNTTLFVENGMACGTGEPPLPFRCPRCGEHERFHSLAALRAHLEFGHTYQPRHNLSLPASKGYSSSHNKRATPETKTKKDAGTDTNSHDFSFSPDAPQNADTCPEPLVSPGKCVAGVEVPTGTELLSAPLPSVGQRLEGMMRMASSSMERRLLRLSSELAQTDTALICERAHSHHLAQERQEVLEREQALSRQVNAAVMVIATLRQQLSLSEHELERREQEVIAIQKFLEAAAQHEICGKVRLRRFIEGLLRRIALAERLLEYYQNNPHQNYCTAHSVSALTETGHLKIKKSRSTVAQPDHDEELLHGHRASGERREHHSWLQGGRSDGYEV
ncbi:protein ZNF365 [Trichomycterus rosablanca]|uniref:protein ZNF365 n=1 Tax=Trichomycterus rosablanca TaxID=2290929 RepID=UPI002F350DC9